VTRNDLDQAVATLRGETTQLRDAVGAMEARIRTEMIAMEARLSTQIKESASEIAQEVANVMVEQLRGQVSVVDEKYKDLPGQYAELRADFDSHVADLSLHRARRPRPPSELAVPDQRWRPHARCDMPSSVSAASHLVKDNDRQATSSSDDFDVAGAHT
jgi:hypothetical protein